MKRDGFIKEVRERGHMSSREEAEKATRATLETLAERLAGEEVEHLASQLPPGIAEHLSMSGREPASLYLWRNSSPGSTSAIRAWTSPELSTTPGW